MKVNLKYPVQYTPIVVELEERDDATALVTALSAFINSRMIEDIPSSGASALRKLRTGLINLGITGYTGS